MTRTHMPGAPFLFFNDAVAGQADIAGPHGMRQMNDGTTHAPRMAHAHEMKV